MFKKIHSSSMPPASQPAHLHLQNDPIAQQTDWGPAKSGGANFKTHKLQRLSDTRYQFRASALALIFYLIFIVVGIGALILAASGELADEGPVAIGIVSIIGLTFTTAGGAMLHFGSMPINIDTKHQAFWRGKKDPSQVFDKTKLKDYAAFSDIHAIQLVSEYCTGSKNNGSYYSYEINLVLTNSERINVIDHGNKNVVVDDACKLAEFTGKPLWNMIS